MQAITTKYHGPTMTRGSRYTATTTSGIRHTVTQRPDEDSTETHRRAAMELAVKLGWSREWKEGSLKDGYVYVPVTGPIDSIYASSYAL
jgi:hypothetical protein